MKLNRKGHNDISQPTDHVLRDMMVVLSHDMSPVKRICVFEHSVMTNFNCACPAIQRGQEAGFLSEGSS